MTGSPAFRIRGATGVRGAGGRAVRAVRGIRSRSERGSAVAEFVMVGGLLTVLTLSVLQLAFALHIRNTLLDAAAEGARYGSFADTGAAAGAERTRDLITAALGESYARGVVASTGSFRGYPATVVTVSSPLPLIGLVGFDGALEVVAHAPIESLG